MHEFDKNILVTMITILLIILGCLTGIHLGRKFVQPTKEMAQYAETKNNSYQAHRFIWSNDASEGAIITYKIPNIQSESIVICLARSLKLAEYWKIKEVNLYFIADGRRHVAISQGPFFVKEKTKDFDAFLDNGSDTIDDICLLTYYEIHNINQDRVEWELDYCFHKAKDGLNIDEIGGEIYNIIITKRFE
jgi:hypothetical protein